MVARHSSSGVTAGTGQEQGGQGRAASQKDEWVEGQHRQWQQVPGLKATESAAGGAGSRQAEEKAKAGLKQRQTTGGHADKTVPQRKQTTAAQGEFQMPKPKQGGQGTPQSGAEEPKKEGSQAKHQEQAGGQGYIFHCTKATEAECSERALFGAPKKQLQQMQGSIQEGSKLFLYNTGTQRVLGPFTALSWPRLDIQQGAWAKTGRKGGFPAQVEVAICKGGTPGTEMEGGRQQAAPLWKQTADGGHKQGRSSTVGGGVGSWRQKGQ